MGNVHLFGVGDRFIQHLGAILFIILCFDLNISQKYLLNDHCFITDDLRNNFIVKENNFVDKLFFLRLDLVAEKFISTKTKLSIQGFVVCWLSNAKKK